MNLDHFLEIEKKYNLLNREVDGYAYWVYARVEIAWRYEQEIDHLHEAHSQKKEKSKIKIYKNIQNLNNIVWHGRMPHKKASFLIINHPRRVLIEKYYECLYTGDLIEKYPDVFVLEKPYQDDHYKPIKEKYYRYTDRIDYQARIYCTIVQLLQNRKFCLLKEKMTQSIEEAIRDMNEYYGVNLESKKFADTFIYGYLIHQVTKKKYKKIVKRIKPKAIIEVVSYSAECMTMNEVAYELKIPTIELQHGAIGSAHTAYNYPPNADIRQFPQYLFLFSDFWKKSDRFPIPESHIIAVGYPYLEKQAERFTNLKKRKSKVISILFLSSGPLGSRLAEEAVRLSQILNSKIYHIIYKLHPGEFTVWKENYPQLLKSNIEVVDNNRVNLYELFSVSSIQIGSYNSTTIFEGLYFQLDTYILNYCACKEFDDLCKSGMAHYFETAEELARMISTAEDYKFSPNSYFWKKDALQNMKDTLTGILDNQYNGESKW